MSKTAQHFRDEHSPHKLCKLSKISKKNNDTFSLAVKQSTDESEAKTLAERFHNVKRGSTGKCLLKSNQTLWTGTTPVSDAFTSDKTPKVIELDEPSEESESASGGTSDPGFRIQGFGDYV